jgi:phage tail sheath gpL-like
MADIPLAVSPSVRSPGTALLIDLKAGPPSPGTGVRRGLLLGVLAATSTIAANTLVTGVSGAADVGVLFGEGTPTHLAALRGFQEYGLAQIDVIGAAVPGGSAAAGTIVFASSPSATRLVRARIAGRVIESDWLAGETAIQGATRLVSKINAQGSNLPVTADNSAGASATVTVTFKQPGNLGNDCTLSVQVIGGAGGTVTPSGATLTGATTEPDWTTALGVVSGREYAGILPIASNADAVSASGTAVAGKLKTHINLYLSGFSAKLQQATIGCTQATNASLKTGAAANNFERIQYVIAREAQSLPCEYGAAEMFSRLRDETPARPNKNRIGQVYVADLYGPLDLVSGTPTDPEVEDDLQNGITPISYDEAGKPYVKRPVTSYFKTPLGAPDDRVLDCPRVTSCDSIGKDLKAFVETSYKGLNLLGNDDVVAPDEIPEGCITPQEVKDNVIARMEFWILNGTVRRSKFKAAVDNGEFICRQNPSDNGQLDLVVPSSIVRHLVKSSIVVQNRA